MKFLTKANVKALPPIGSSASLPHDKTVVHVKFFTPDSNWTWYAIEFDGEDEFFGLVCGFEVELGYWSMAELQSVRGPLGLPVERDLWFKPCPLTQVPEYENWAGSD